MGELILVTSGKGGTGKTTVAAALACSLARRGLRVLAVDCDFGLGNLDIALGTSERVLFDFGDYLSELVPPKQVIMPVEGFEGLEMIPASGEAFQRTDASRLKRAMEALKNGWDIVVADGPAGLGEITGACAECADIALIVTNPETAGLRDAATTARFLRGYGLPDIRVVLNRLDKSRVRSGTCKSVDDAIDALGLRLVGLIREDVAAANAFTAEQPLLSKETDAGGDIRDIASRLMGEMPDIRKYKKYI